MFFERNPSSRFDHHTTCASRTTGRLLACCASVWFAIGCGSPQEGEAQESNPQSRELQPSPVPQSTLDPVMLHAALDEQHSFEAMGVSLKARAWFQADSYVAQYQTSDGTLLGTQRIGKESLIAGVELPTLAKGESLDDFKKRTNVTGPTRVADLSTDQIWFTPAKIEAGREAPGVGTVRAASTIADVAAALVACNKLARHNCLNETVGYFDAHAASTDPTANPAAVFTWAFSSGVDPLQRGSGGLELGSAKDYGLARGTAAYSAACAGSVAATFEFNVSNAAQGIKTISNWSQSIPPLSMFGMAVGEGWNDFHCGPLTPGCRYRVDFNAADFNFRVSPGNNLETFCGKVTTQQSIYYSDACNETIGTGCPGFTEPSVVNVGSVWN